MTISGAVRWFVTNPRTGKLAIAQWPNPPLAVYLLATVARIVIDPAGAARTVISLIASVAILVWAGLEIAAGDSPFRRLLGAVVLVSTVVGLAT